ncbi:response regulator transcription factor [Streptomyces sp. CSDS2]|uniref:LuxR C-terminal-related transcriptional regulator n=1 Tax=Streptomyces sp. CSDS2 TaxID=3055051 RepID=UPI0025AFEFDB|nr:response regulator transcription factor [Streptomyces sp. CSDS2]MDN3260897.1 response regulator transcription factor [Streptomyces sp. CSDS2]
MDVVVAGGHTLLLSALCALLAREGDIRVVGQTAEVGQVMDLARAHHPDVVLLHLERMDLAAVHTVLELRSRCAGTRVIVMTGFEDAAFLRALVRAGAQRCLSSKVTYSALVAAVQGEERDRSAASSLLVTLTPRESEIMRYVARALSNRQIGRRLEITEDTVKRHLYNVFKKLGVGSRLEAVNRLYGGRTVSAVAEASHGAA